MTTNDATPAIARRPGRPAKGKQFPAGLAILLTNAQRRAIDALVQVDDSTLGAVSRGLLADGLDLDAVYRRRPELRGEVLRLAFDGGVGFDEALETLLVFAVREARRRAERNAEIAIKLAQSMASSGVPFDGVSVGSVDISAEQP